MTTISSIRQPVATLSGGQRQSVAVARAVMWNSRLVILDEPTAALGVSQTEQVLELVERLAEQGLAVILISHNLHDIFEVATRITVLRLGRDIGVYERSKTTQEEVVHAITAGIPTKVSGISGDAAERQHELRPPRPSPRGPKRAVSEHGRSVNVRTGNLGSGPVIVALAFVILYFGLTTPNWFTPVNFMNLIGQMAGMCMLAYGVVFVLLIGEIDLSIGFVSGIAGVVVALLQVPTGAHLPVVSSASSIALLATTVIGAFQGSFVALIGVPSFVVTLAGLLIWQGVILLIDHPGRDRDPGQHDQQRLRLLLQRQGGLDHRHRRQRRVHRRHARGGASRPPARDPDPRPISVGPEAAA